MPQPAHANHATTTSALNNCRIPQLLDFLVRETQQLAQQNDADAKARRPEMLLDLMKANGVSRTVIIQVIHYRYDNSFLADVLKRACRGLQRRDQFVQRFASGLDVVDAAAAQAWLAPIGDHLADAALGQVSEIFDGDENAIVDFKYSSSPRLTWWFDHHQSAFLSPEDAAHFRLDRSGQAWSMLEGASGFAFHVAGDGDLGLAAGQAMTLDTTDRGEILLAPKRKDVLADLIAQCDPKAPPPADLALWGVAKPAGQEVW